MPNRDLGHSSQNPERSQQSPDEREQVRPPASVQELLAATLGGGAYSIGVFEELWNRVKHIPDEYSFPIHLVRYEIETRIRRFLLQPKDKEDGKPKKKQEPTEYATLLIKAITGVQKLTPDESQELADLSFQVISQLQPLLRNILQTLEGAAGHLTELESIKALANPATFHDHISTGVVRKNKTNSLFGVLDAIALHTKDFPRLNLAETKQPIELTIEDPFAADLDAYWKEKQKTLTPRSGKKPTIPELCAMRSHAAWYELSERATHLKKALDLQQKKLDSVTNEAKREEISRKCDALKKSLDACFFLASWISKEAQSIERVKPQVFHTHLASFALHARKPKETFDLINHLEQLKTNDPDLYMRLLGLQSVPISPTDTRSDVYGNVLHASVHRARYTRFESKEKEWQELQERIRSLTNLAHEAVPLQFTSDYQWEKLQQRARGVARRGTIGEEAVQVGMLGNMIGYFAPGYRMRKFLETTDFEKRERVLAQLRLASPSEFIRLVQENFKGKETDPPADLAEVFRERELFDFYVSTRGSGYGNTWYSATSERVYEGIKEVRQSELGAHLLFSPSGLEFCLFRSTPSEELVRGNEFFHFIRNCADHDFMLLFATVPRWALRHPPDDYYRRTEIYTRKNAMNKEFARYATEELLAILDAHPDITKEQWHQWAMDNTRRPSGDTNTDMLDQKKVDVIKGFLKHVSPDDVYRSQSNFFRNLSMVNRTAGPEFFYNHYNDNGKTFFYTVFGLDDTSSEEEKQKVEKYLKDPIKKFVLLYKIFPLDRFIDTFWPRIVRECDVVKFCQQLSKDVSPQAEQEFLIALLSLLRQANTEAVRDRKDTHGDSLDPLHVSIDSLRRLINHMEVVFRNQNLTALDFDELYVFDPYYDSLFLGNKPLKKRALNEHLRRKKTPRGNYWISEYLDLVDNIWRPIGGKGQNIPRAKERRIPPKIEKP